MQQAFITGCDKKSQWMLPWFKRNYQNNHNKTPLLFADCGVSSECLVWCQDNFDLVIPQQDLGSIFGCKWFLKPLALSLVNAESKVWLDTDCEINNNIESIFDYLIENKLNMVPDHPWRKRTGEPWHNSGVIGIKGQNPKILYEWILNIRMNDNPISPIYRGDQEVLHAMIQNNKIIGIREQYINDLPHKYNVLRLDLLDNNIPPEAFIHHWTGVKGKEEIKHKMRYK